jgi:hypothetical protein
MPNLENFPTSKSAPACRSLKPSNGNGKRTKKCKGHANSSLYDINRGTARPLCSMAQVQLYIRIFPAVCSADLQMQSNEIPASPSQRIDPRYAPTDRIKLAATHQATQSVTNMNAISTIQLMIDTNGETCFHPDLHMTTSASTS